MRTIKAIKIKDVIELLGYKEREYEFKGISGVRHIRCKRARGRQKHLSK